ncbi:putative bifunctional diguanylate cyclase/phosphodiesterase [Jeotgalibacillus aurantiacus]|uniref:putative bifunctional diguanylate cyclase/phosphodiesterase n=1 Tax=Jeotgalibacillus aurantiacus TaxID=2763266 RepID=UPI001D0ACF10|nr:EAL domain-containing protein [Jeotgalibacillus aurantiacus]
MRHSRTFSLSSSLTDEDLLIDKRPVEILESAFLHYPGLIATINISGDIVDLKGNTVTLLGYEQHDMIGTKATNYLSMHAPGLTDEIFLTALQHGQTLNINLNVIHQNGSAVPMYVKCLPVIKNEEVKGMIIIGNMVVDEEVVKELRTQLTELAEEGRIAKSIHERLDVGIWSLDMKNYKFTYLSKSIENITGATAAEFDQDPKLWRSLLHPEDVHIIDDYQELLRKGEAVKVEYRLIYKDKQLRWIEHQAMPYLNQIGELTRVDGFIMDITERKKLEESIHHFENHDYLTGLMNRKQFTKRLGKVIKSFSMFDEQPSLWVFYIDIDQFKSINDLYSHSVGDQVLASFASRLVRFVGDKGFCARVSGDEFLIAVTNIGSDDHIEHFAADLLDEMESPVIVEEEELYLTVSIGASVYDLHAKQPHTLIKYADLALHRVKMSGRNDWMIFNESIEQEEKEIDQIAHDLRFAIEREQFFILYQPKVNAQTRTITGAEALIRWNHPDAGLIRPSTFIPLAEKHGMISLIDSWVFREVCKDLDTWRKSSHPLLPVSINVSPNRLLKSDFVEQTLRQIKEFDLPPSLIEFELTETSIIMNPVKVKSVMSELQNAGIRFSLDDFGTGYSSLSYLQMFDINTLKVDRSLIQDVQKTTKNQIIAKNLFRMAQEMEIDIIAEGVETQEEMEFLVSQNCSIIQGYFFSRPLTLESLMVYSDVLAETRRKSGGQ